MSNAAFINVISKVIISKVFISIVIVWHKCAGEAYLCQISIQLFITKPVISCFIIAFVNMN